MDALWSCVYVVHVALQQKHFTGFFEMDVTRYHGRTAGMCLFCLLDTIRDKKRREKTSERALGAAGLRVKLGYGK